MLVLFTHSSTSYIPATDLHNKLYLSPPVSIPTSQPAQTAVEPNNCDLANYRSALYCSLVFRLQTVNTFSLCPFSELFCHLFLMSQHVF